MITTILRAAVRVGVGSMTRSRGKMLALTTGVTLVVAPSFFGAAAASRRPVGADEATTKQDLAAREPAERPSPGPLVSVGAAGVATRPILMAAAAFAATLALDQHGRMDFPGDDAAWVDRLDGRSGSRPGLSLAALTGPQRDAARELIRASLAADGLPAAAGVEPIRRALADPGAVDHIALLGDPSADGAWGWQLDGPGLVVNYFVAGDRVVVTPTRLVPASPVLVAGRP